MKICTKCKVKKPLLEFFTDNKAKDKKSYRCKKCHTRSSYLTKEDHIKRLLSGVKHRAKQNNLPFNLTVNYLIKIATDICPVFNTKLLWAENRIKGDPNSPSLDRIVPNLGYTKGNVAFISFKANSIKSNATEKEIRQVADWLKQYG